MKSLKFDKLLLFVILIPTVSSLIISSVYAGKKKFKTFSFSKHLPSIVKVQPNRLHLTFRQSKYVKPPSFKIEGTLPLKAPTIIKELFQPDPHPEVSEYNFGNVLTDHEDYHVYSGSNNHQVIAPQASPYNSRPPQPQPLNSPSPHQPFVPMHKVQRFTDPHIQHHSSGFTPRHRIARRSANDFRSQHPIGSENTYFDGNFRQSFQMDPQIGNNYQNLDNHYLNHQHHQSYQLPPNGQNYYNAHNYHNPDYGLSSYNHPQQSHDQYNANAYQSSQQSNPYNQHSANSYNNYQNPMMASSSSFNPQKYHKVIVPSNQQSTKWTPIINGHNNYAVSNNPMGVYNSDRVPHHMHSNDNLAEADSKKVNIGEHYNPSASYADESVAEKPTYDPDEGSISFSISGPHGGEVPYGTEAKINEQIQQLKKYPDQLPPDLDGPQLAKYYHHHTFTDSLKSDYGYVEAKGPLSFLKSKLASLKKLI